MAGVVPKASAIHGKVAQDQHLLNRARQLCHSTTPHGPQPAMSST